MTEVLQTGKGWTDGQLLCLGVVSAFGGFPGWKMHALICGQSSVQVLCLFAWKMKMWVFFSCVAKPIFGCYFLFFSL